MKSKLITIFFILSILCINLTARYYNPNIGRFITADTETPGEGSDLQGLNRYSYCSNNPVIYIDPTGHKVETFIDYENKKKLNLDKYGVPEKLQRTFNEEYGFRIGFEQRKGSMPGVGYFKYIEDVETENKVSETARYMMLKEFKSETISGARLLIYYDFIYAKDGSNAIPFYFQKNNNFTSFEQGKAFILLSEINDDLTLKNYDYDKSILPFGVKEFPKRSANLARMLEHEFLGHALLGLGDYPGQKLISTDSIFSHINIITYQFSNSFTTSNFESKITKEIGLPGRIRHNFTIIPKKGTFLDFKDDKNRLYRLRVK